MKKVWNHYSYTIILIMISFAVALVLSFQFGPFHQSTYLKVTVSQGDSLWKIASKYSTLHSLTNNDFVDWVQTHNNLDGDRIYPGEKIMIPVTTQPSTGNEFASAAGK